MWQNQFGHSLHILPDSSISKMTGYLELIVLRFEVTFENKTALNILLHTYSVNQRPSVFGTHLLTSVPPAPCSLATVAFSKSYVPALSLPTHHSLKFLE